MAEEELKKIEKMVGEDKFEGGKFLIAKELLDKLSTGKKFNEFLTVRAYERI